MDKTVVAVMTAVRTAETTHSIVSRTSQSGFTLSLTVRRPFGMSSPLLSQMPFHNHFLSVPSRDWTLFVSMSKSVNIPQAQENGVASMVTSTPCGACHMCQWLASTQGWKEGLSRDCALASRLEAKALAEVRSWALVMWSCEQSWSSLFITCWRARGKHDGQLNLCLLWSSDNPSQWYASTNETQIAQIYTELIFFTQGRHKLTPNVYEHALMPSCFQC